MKKRITMLGFIWLLMIVTSCKSTVVDNTPDSKQEINWQSAAYDTLNTIRKADQFLSIDPQPITLTSSPRSAGTVNDFYSEGDYWWPDPKNPDGPYIRKDGLSNPNNFLDHRKAMRNLSEWVSTLTAAYVFTGESKYKDHAIKHLQAFFLDDNTKMNPHLLYAQAIQGRHTGRGIGIIDTIHLMEVAKSIEVLIAKSAIPKPVGNGLKDWFEQYSVWMTTHQYGIDERDHGNNHSTWWAAQLAAFANLTEREDHMQIAQEQFKKLLTNQMDDRGAFPDELERTKAYNYSLFNLEAYAVLAHIASDKSVDLWNYETPHGSLEKAWDFMIPFIEDKSSWIKPPDVSHFDEIPIQTVGVLLAGLSYDDEEIINTWKSLPKDKESQEIRRNFPFWEPILWTM